jgi:hypothetical protein
MGKGYFIFIKSLTLNLSFKKSKFFLSCYLDPHSFSKLDSDPPSLKKLDPDPHKVNADSQHCYRYKRFFT